MSELRLAGEGLGLDVREGMGRFDLDEMRRGNTEKEGSQKF